MTGSGASAESLDDLVDRFGRGERRALARLITLLESGTPAERILDRVRAHGLADAKRRSGAALKVGLTGSMGVGKSSLAGALIRHARRGSLNVALVACDPGSRRSGGALLGDRLRVDAEVGDEGVFIRSLSTRGAEGGIAMSAGPAVRLLGAFGFDFVLLETIGVGQDQAAVRAEVDVLVLVTAPGAGDAVQWQKAGLLEEADVFAVSKADLPGADAVLADLREELAIDAEGGAMAGDGAMVSREAVKVSVRTGEGIDSLWEAVERAGARCFQGDKEKPSG